MSLFGTELEQQLLSMLDGTDRAYADALGILYHRRREWAHALRDSPGLLSDHHEMIDEFNALEATLRERWRVLGPGGGPGSVPGVYCFTVSGQLNGRPAEITWDQGRLSGDPEAVRRLEALATAREGQVVAIGDAYETETAHLADPLTAHHLMRELLGWEAKSSGTYPRIPPPPTGYRR